MAGTNTKALPPVGHGPAGYDGEFPTTPRSTTMRRHFKVGDNVTWNSEAGHVSGRIIRIHTADFDYKGHTHHATPGDPQYEIASNKTDHVAAHKGTALSLADAREHR
jgi:hypothetical protein